MTELNVLHIYKTNLKASIGGIEVFIDNLCRRTSAYNVKNTLLCFSGNSSSVNFEMNGYSVVECKRTLMFGSTAFSLPAFSSYRQLVKNADIVHYHFPHPFNDILHLLAPIKKPSLVTYHSDIVRQKNLMKLYRPIMSRFLRSMDAIVSTSPSYLITSNVLVDYLNKVSVIPIGMSRDDLPMLDWKRMRCWRKRLPDKFYLFIGSMRYYKGLIYALKAVERTNINFVIAGAGGVEEILRCYVQENRMQNVFFLGEVSNFDKVVLLHLCYGFVFPSCLKSEAFGVALLEAALMGKPMISCEIGTGTSYVNIHNRTGLIVRPNSVSELQHAMAYLLDRPAIARSFGVHARNRARRLFSADLQARSYCDLYKKILQDNVQTTIP